MSWRKPSTPGPPSSPEIRRQLFAVATIVALLAIAWHVAPVALWHLRFEGLLAAEGAGARLRSAERTPRPPAPDWRTLRVANFSLRFPLVPGEEPRCAACASHCVLPLEGGGTLAVFDAPPAEDLLEARDRFAPDARDLSLLRSVRSNWRTIDALTDRARARPEPPESFRFRSVGGHGVISRFLVKDRSRYVVYAYAPGGQPTRVLGVTGVSEARFDRILGGLEISARSESEAKATCR